MRRRIARTLGEHTDLVRAVAVRAMIDHLGSENDLSREDAYVLASLCVDLKISEVVDAGSGWSARCCRWRCSGAEALEAWVP
jgi:acetamidase/formamidase